MVNKKSIFVNMDKLEQSLFISKLLQALREDNEAYYDAAKIVQKQEMKGTYDNTKFFNKNIHDET